MISFAAANDGLQLNKYERNISCNSISPEITALRTIPHFHKTASIPSTLHGLPGDWRIDWEFRCLHLQLSERLHYLHPNNHLRILRRSTTELIHENLQSYVFIVMTNDMSYFLGHLNINKIWIEFQIWIHRFSVNLIFKNSIVKSLILNHQACKIDVPSIFYKTKNCGLLHSPILFIISYAVIKNLNTPLHLWIKNLTKSLAVSWNRLE